MYSVCLETEIDSPKCTWFRAYLEGNVIMPQTYDAGAIFLARAALQKGDVDVLAKAKRLSASQLSMLRRAMERAHQVRRVPAGGSVYLEQIRNDSRYEMSRAITIDDERLHYIWNRFLERAVMITKSLSGKSDGFIVANQLVEGFHTEHCRNLLRKYREQYDRRQHGSDDVAAELKQIILNYLVEQVSLKHRGLLRELFAA